MNQKVREKIKSFLIVGLLGLSTVLTWIVIQKQPQKQELSKVEIFKLDQQCLTHKDEIEKEKEYKPTLDDRRFGLNTESIVTEIFYSPAINKCVFVVYSVDYKDKYEDYQIHELGNSVRINRYTKTNGKNQPPLGEFESPFLATSARIRWLKGETKIEPEK